MVEFFAGKGNLTKFMRLSEIRTASLDLLYEAEQRVEKRVTNPMDLLSTSGFACPVCISRPRSILLFRLVVMRCDFLVLMVEWPNHSGGRWFEACRGMHT